MNARSSLHIAADIHNLGAIRQFVEQAALALGADPAALPDVIQATDEIATNIIVHGYRDQSGAIDIEVEANGNSLVVHVRDRAALFDPTSFPAPDVSLPLDQRPLGGLGIYLARRFVTEMIYRALPEGGNELTLIKQASLQPPIADRASIDRNLLRQGDRQ